MAVYTPIQRKWWFWTIVGIMALPLLVLGVRAIGIAAVDTPTRDVTDWEALSIYRTPSPEPAATPEPAPTPKPVLTPQPTPQTTPPPSPDFGQATIRPFGKETKQDSAQTQAAASATAPAASSSAYADFLTGIYQAIMNDMDTFNQLDQAMKKNEDLLYDDSWLDNLFANVSTIESHCKEVINYSAVPDRYQAIHDEFKTGCQTLLKGLNKYIYGVDLMEGDARIEGRNLMRQAQGNFNTAIASLQ